MKYTLVLLLTSVLIALPLLTAALLPPVEPPPSTQPLTLSPEIAPIYFTPDATGTRFDAISHDFSVQLGNGKVVLGFATGETIEVLFEGSIPSAPQGEEPVAAKANFYRGNDPGGWREGVPLYAQVVYRDLYPGIDLIYFFAEGQLKSEFILHPGAKTETIQIRYTGVATLHVSNNEIFVTVNSDLVLREAIPLAYQEVNGQQYSVTAAFQMRAPTTYGFVIRETLIPGARVIIDPVLRYSTYLGGSARDEALAIATDYVGNSYVTGRTWSQDFPVLHPIQPHHAGSGDKDVFIAKFDVRGNLVYATYYGGTAGEQGNAITADAAGNAYVAGQSHSADLPVLNAWQPTFAGNEDAYVLKLDPLGRLQWATYIGGTGFEEANAIAVDSQGRVYVGGEVYSDDFPLLNPWSSATYGPGDEDGFISIFDPDGQLLYSTYISAPQRDQIFAITVDENGHVYAAGMTSSPDFPVHNALQPNYGGGWEDCLILKLDPWNNELHFATFLGGLDREACWGIDLDQEGNFYVSGYTSSPDFPTVNAHQATKRGQEAGMSDTFVAKLNLAGTQLRYATYLGGSGTDRSWGLVSDHLGNVYITGQTNSPDFPTHQALQPFYGGGGNDGFIAIFASAGDLLYASYLGGPGEDRLWDIALDGSWIVHLAGTSDSPNLSTGNAHQRHNAGESDALVSRLAFIPTPTPTPTPTPYASANIGPEGGNLWISYPAHLTLLQVPPNALNATTIFELVYDERPNSQGALQGLNHFFLLRIQDPQHVISPLQLNLAYQETHGVIMDTLALYRLETGTWVTHNITITERGPGYLVAWIDQPGTYGVLGETNRLHLPLVLRRR